MALVPRWLLAVLIVAGVGVVVSVVVGAVWKRGRGSLHLGSFDIDVPDGWRAWDDKKSMPPNSVGLVSEAMVDGEPTSTILVTLDAPAPGSCEATPDIRDFKKTSDGGCTGTKPLGAVDAELAARPVDGKEVTVQCFHAPNDADGSRACASVRTAVGFR